MRERLHPLREGEDGKVMILMLGVAMVVIALVLVVASVSAVHIQRKQLLAAADAAALSAAASLDEAGFYAEGGNRLVVSDQSVHTAVTDYLADHAGPLGLRDVRVGIPTGEEDGAVVVTLSALAEVPFAPWLTDAIPDALRVEVSVRARALESYVP